MGAGPDHRPAAAPPPPDIPAIEPDIRGATTIRQQLDKHRNTPACASCHRHIDPPGFALENFDVIGGWRDFYRGQPGRHGLVELANYPGRKFFRGPDVEMGGETARRPSRSRTSTTTSSSCSRTRTSWPATWRRSCLIYATGADIQFADREVVEDLVAQCRHQRLRLPLAGARGRAEPGVSEQVKRPSSSPLRRPPPCLAPR